MAETRKRAPRKAAAKTETNEVTSEQLAENSITADKVAHDAAVTKAESTDTQPVEVQDEAPTEEAPKDDKAEGVIKAFKAHDIDPDKIPANNAIYTDGYITVESLGGVERPKLNPWPSDKARADVFAAWWTAEGAKV
jgi:hypothetical protein